MPVRILVVEDDVSLGENLCEILGLFGYAPLGVGSAEEALDALTAAPVDLILTDLQLPRMSGADLLACLRAQGRAVPAVLMTDWKIDKADDAGQSQVERLSKPLDIAGLLGAISRLLGAAASDVPAPAAPRFTKM